mgnify:CR=1 FL=1
MQELNDFITALGQHTKFTGLYKYDFSVKLSQSELLN